MPREDWIDRIKSRQQTQAVQVAKDAKPQLESLTGIRAVIFDVYGTLISSGVGDISLATEQDRDQQLKATLRENGLSLPAEVAHIRFDSLLHTEIKTAQDIRRKDGIQYPEVEIREVWKSFIENLQKSGYIDQSKPVELETLIIDYESRINPTQAMPGLSKTLSTLVNRGFAMSLISNAQFYTPLLFDTFLRQDIDSLGFCKQCSVWSYQEREGKPSTRLYEIAAEQMMTHHGIEASEVLYIGNDMRNDIWPAQIVGFNTVLFAGDALSLRRRQDDPNCKNVIPDLEITDLRQILDCI